MERCSWCRGDPVMEEYHDTEWGIPVYRDNEIFERMVLEMFQAGLSWRTILHKRPAFRNAFHNFDLHRVAAINEHEVDHLLTQKDIVRHRKKIESAVFNARVCVAICEEYGSLQQYLETLQNWTLEEIRKEFKQRFRFMGPVVTESFLQCMGLVGPLHEPGCWKQEQEGE